MATTPETTPTPQEAPGQQNSGPGLRQQYRLPEGAIPIAKLKRLGLACGILVLGYFTVCGSCNRAPTVAPKSKPTAQVWPMSPANIDSQQAELEREMEEAKRAAEQAEFAKRRAQSTLESDGPHNAQADPVAQLRKQLQLEDLRRAHTASYASTVAFAPSGEHRTQPKGETEKDPASTAEPKPEPNSRAPMASDQSTPHSNEPAPGTYRLDEGTILETVLLNRLDGEFSGPVIAQVAEPVYSRAGLELLIPKGSRLLGEAREVNGFDQRRLAILFHRLILSNGKAISLDKFRGLDQIGETGVVSKVDHHYLEIFGTSLALGAIGGLTQIGAYGGFGYDPAVSFRVGVTQRMGSNAEQVLAKFLNKYPTIQVREGTRLKVILTNDLNLEAYE